VNRQVTSIERVLDARRVIPRWVPPHLAEERDSLNVEKIAARKRRSEKWVQKLGRRFDARPSDANAMELVETAMVHGQFELVGNAPKIAAAAQRGRALESVQFQRPIGEDFGEDGNESSFNLFQTINFAARKIAVLRTAVRSCAARPLVWSELARQYLIVGQYEKAKKAMAVALRLSHGSRYILRAATRLYVEVECPDEALHLLRSKESMQSDPWLIAAEIATSSLMSKRSRQIDAGRRFLNSFGGNERQLSELASAIGTIELISGGYKEAKALFRKSLVDPTENSLAQAQWAHGMDLNLPIPESAWTSGDPHEARALMYRRDRNWSQAISACAEWLYLEPYSDQAAILGSYMGFRPEHNRLAEQFASVGLNSNRNSFQLLNNRAVMRAYLGKVDEAYDDLTAALDIPEAHDDAHLLATLGLLAYRSGMHEVGKRFYFSSISWFLQRRAYASAATATLYFAREEIRVSSSFRMEASRLAKRIGSSPLAVQNPELVGISDLVLEELSGCSEDNTAVITAQKHFSEDELLGHAGRMKSPVEVAAVQFTSSSDNPIERLKLRDE